MSTSETVNGEMDRLRKSKPELSLVLLYNMFDTCMFKVAFLNARSLHRHLVDDKSDYNLQVAEVVCFF